MRIYLANKMQGIPYFNAPWFDQAEAELRELLGPDAEIFNPAEHDRKQGFDPMCCPTGDLEEAHAHGFILENALVADWTWIGTKADCVVLGPDWMNSKGAISEAACIQGLRKPAYEYVVFLRYYPYARYNPEVLLAHALPPIMELGGPAILPLSSELTSQSFGFKGTGWF